MRPRALTTRAICTTCLSPSQESHQRSHNAHHSQRASFRQMTSDLKSWSNLLTAEPQKKETLNPKTIYIRVATVPSATIFLTTNLFLTNLMTLLKFTSVQKFWICCTAKVLIRDWLTTSAPSLQGPLYQPTSASCNSLQKNCSTSSAMRINLQNKKISAKVLKLNPSTVTAI